MPHQLSEDAFQKAILKALAKDDDLGLCYEAYKRYDVVYRPDQAVPAGGIHYDRALALLPHVFPNFVKATQEKAWSRLQSGGGDTDRTLTLALKTALDTRGALDVLRRGITVNGVAIHVAHFPPTDNRPDDTDWRHNRFVLIEELEYDPNQPEGHKGRLDLALFLNGIPLITVELKNLGTQQTVGNAIEQYEKTRSSTAPIFRFPYRAVAHFVVDQRRAFMTTRVQGAKTRWFPFDERSADDANVESPGPRTAFLWNQVWRPRSLLALIRDFAVLQPPEPSPVGAPARHPLQDAALIFPRVHQRRVVLNLLLAMNEDGPGGRYLVQHSTGSGKSYSIGWLAVMAASLYRASARAFDKVLIVSDRRIIHRQLCDLIRSLSPANVETDDMVASVDSGSASLVTALAGTQPLIISTVHAFFHARKEVAQQTGKCFCVLIDEAHRSQGGDLNKAMRSVLDELGKETAANVSMVAFTATPTDLTLQRFGRKVSDTEYRPHDAYTMRQARREGFIVSVLQNYVVWKQIATATVEARAQQLIKQGGSSVKDILAQDEEMVILKAKLVAKHFLETVKDQLGTQARAMVVTVSKTAAIRYRDALREELSGQGAGSIGVLIAFTGSHTVVREGEQVSVTEGSLNGRDQEGRLIQDERVADALRRTHRILIAVDKFQTGFDEPKLLAMYVDKSLRDINAVQTLSRLNRPYPGKGRRFRPTDPPPVSPFVVDFYDNTEDVVSAFTKYDRAALPQTFVPEDLLVRLGQQIRAIGTYTKEVLDEIWELWSARSQEADSDRFHALLNGVLDEFEAMGSDEDRLTFRHKVSRFVFYWSAAHEVVAGVLSAEARLSLEKQALLYAKILPTLNDWSPGGDAQPAQRLRADHVSFEDQDLQFVTQQALLPADADDYGDPREITVGSPKQRRYRTLEELVAVFNAEYGPTGAEVEQPATKDLVDQLEGAVVAATEAMAEDQAVSFMDYRRRLEPELRRSIREAARSGTLPRDLARFTFAERDRFEALADRLAEAGFDILREGA